MSRFALHRQGQNSHVCTRWHAMACRGSTLVLPHSAGPGHCPTERNVSPGTDRRKVSSRPWATGLPPWRNRREPGKLTDELARSRIAALTKMLPTL